MNATQLAARRRHLAAETARIVETKGLSNGQKMTQLDRIEAEVKGLDAEYEILVKAHQYALGDMSTTAPHAEAKALGHAPLHLDRAQTEALFKSANDGVGISVKALPTTTGTLDPATHSSQVLPPVGVAREATRIMDLIPSTAMDAGVIEYYVASVSGTGAGPTAEGAQKPDSQLTLTKATATPTKLAVYSSATEESLQDFGAFSQYLQAELVSQIIDAENAALLSATGTGASTFKGFLTATGTQTIAASGGYAGFTNLDLIGAAMDNLRASGRLVQPTGIVMHPTTWGAIRRSKAGGTGDYLIGAPTLVGPMTLWGIPVVVTTQVPTTKALIANFGEAATVHVRAGLTVRSNPNGSGFRNNVVEFVAEERIALTITAPSAVCVATLA